MPVIWGSSPAWAMHGQGLHIFFAWGTDGRHAFLAASLPSLHHVSSARFCFVPSARDSCIYFVLYPLNYGRFRILC